jgi:nitrogen fixation NifU-like protein
MDDLYRDYILEHYRAPHNSGVLAAPSVVVEGYNPLCGDRITLMLGVEDGVVREVAFNGAGCAISTASASLLTDEIKDKTLEQVAALGPDRVFELLGIEISPTQMRLAQPGHPIGGADATRGGGLGRSVAKPWRSSPYTEKLG